MRREEAVLAAASLAPERPSVTPVGRPNNTLRYAAAYLCLLHGQVELAFVLCRAPYTGTYLSDSTDGLFASCTTRRAGSYILEKERRASLFAPKVGIGVYAIHPAYVPAIFS